MRVSVLLSGLLVGLMACTSGLENLPTKTSKSDLVFDSLAQTWDEGVPLGNATIGALVWKKGDALRLSLDRTDLWDLRPSDSLSGANFRFAWVKEHIRTKDYLPVQKKLDHPDEAKAAYIQMDGQSVFKFAVRRVPEIVEELLEKAQIQKEEISYFFLHQANRRIIEAAAKRTGVDISRFPMNLQEYGNTSAASIPILLDEWNKKGLLKKGDKLVLAGFGAGLSWAGSLLEW